MDEQTEAKEANHTSKVTRVDGLTLKPGSLSLALLPHIHPVRVYDPNPWETEIETEKVKSWSKFIH